jgi:lipid-A-disaccharide synthase
MSPTKHIVVVAGEESGDQHAAAFVRQLQQSHPDLQFSGIGGQHMQDAGVRLVSDLARYGVTGLSEILRHAKKIRKAFVQITQHLEQTRPQLLILVDYPGFNLRLAKYAKKVLNIRILYYISPQIWAWKADRIHTIRQYVDKMAVILPFEKAIYQQAGVPVAFVGHPLVARMQVPESIAETKKQLGIPSDKLILALLPGSRHNEIKRLLPILKKVAKNLLQAYSNLHIVIPVARSLTQSDRTALVSLKALPITLIEQQAVQTVYSSDFVIVASGTASLECALLTKPMCIVYKASLLTYIIAFRCIRIKYLGLCNLLQNKMIVPELLQYDCSTKELTKLMLDLMSDSTKSQRMVMRLQSLKQTLSAQQADISMSELILQELEA